MKNSGSTRRDLIVSALFFCTLLLCGNAIAQPVIGSLSTNIGVPGSSINISGSNFNTNPVNNIVYFGATKATVNTASATSLGVTVPVGATYAPVTVNNTATHLMGYSDYSFLPRYNNSGYLPGAINFDSNVSFTDAGSNTPVQVVIADIDGDGTPDLVVMNNIGFSVYRNTSTSGSITSGSFATAVDFTVTGNVAQYGEPQLAVGDIDGDGKQDVCICNGSDTIYVMRNTSSIGTVNFTSPVFFLGNSYYWGTDYFASIAIIDIDGDGKADIVCGDGMGIAVFRNMGTAGTITSSSLATSIVFEGAGYSGIAIGDLDGDGKPDVVGTIGSTAGDNLTVYKNTSSPGVINFATSVGFATGNYPANVLISDIDGDGKPDLAFLNQGDGTLGLMRNTATTGTIDASSFAAQVVFAAGYSPWGLASGDFDGDGKPDIAVSSPYTLLATFGQTVQIFHNIASAGTIDTNSLNGNENVVAGNPIVSIAVGDIDGDSKADIVTVNQADNSISVLRNAPLYPSPTITSVSPDINSPGTSVTITGTNFNTTAANDIVYFGATRATVNTASATSLTVTVPIGATYAPVTVNNTATNLMGYSEHAFLPDYNNSAYVPGTVNFDPEVGFTDAANSNISQVVIADIDGDGKPDLIVAGATISIYRNISTSGSITAGSFAAPIDISVTGNNLFVATGDIDGDGKPDMVVSGLYSDSIYVFRNTSTSGSVNFAPYVAFTENTSYTPQGPINIAIGDIDGDGKADIITGTYGAQYFAVFRNTATAGTIDASSLATAVDFPAAITGSGGNSFVAIGDLDGDGKPDVVITNDYIDVWVMHNTSTAGSPSFAAGVDFTAGNGTTFIAISDIDGDGKADLAISNTNDGTVSILRNTATAGTINASSFAAQVVFAVGYDPYSIVWGDFDGDGKPDLAVSSGLYTATPLFTYVFRNTSTPGVINSSSLTGKMYAGAASTISSVVAGDIDGDGKTDIITANFSSNTISVLRNDPLLPVITSVNPTIAAAGATVTISGANFNTTSANDIVYFGATRASVTSASATSLSVTVPVGATYAPVSVTNTLNGLAAFSTNAFLPNYNNSAYLPGLVNFDPHVDFTDPGGVYPGKTVIADIDGDGKPDMITVGGFGISVYLNTSTSGTITSGSFGTAADFTVPGGWGSTLGAGDIDGDGKPDLVVAGNGNIVLFRNTSTTGSVSLASPVTIAADFMDNNPYAIAIADLNGDGKPDVIVSDAYYGNIAVYLNTATVGTIDVNSLTTGAGVESAGLDFPIPGGGGYLHGLAVGDLDGDGIPDVAVADINNNVVWVFRNTFLSGAVGFAAPVSFATGNGVNDVLIADIDGDGKPDLAAVNLSDNSISLLRNTSTVGAPSFASQVVFATGNQPYTIASGDFDGDGKPDLAVENYSDNTISVFRNTATAGNINTGSLATSSVFATGNGPQYIAAGDMDGDGKTDIVVANTNDGSISVLRNYPLYPHPTITSVSPLIDSPGTSVTITGTNFNTTATNDIVYFGATRATVNTASATSLTVTVPIGATYAPVMVDNTLHGLMALSPKAFLPNYDNNAYAQGVINFDPKVTFTDPGGVGGGQMLIADIDGDGKPDMITSTGASISVYRNISASGSITSGSFATAVDFVVPSAIGGALTFGYGAIAAGDIDGDGKPDLVFAGNDASNNFYIFAFRNTSTSGSISFASPGVIPYISSDEEPTSIAIADIDGDGKADVVTANFYGNVSVFLNSATVGIINSSSFAAPIDFGNWGTASGQKLAVGDLDGDGKPDLAYTDYFNNVSVQLNTSTIGVAGFAAPVSFAAGNAPYGIVIADIDGDGKPDLAVTNVTDNTISLFRNTATVGSIDGSSFASQVVFTTGMGPFDVASGDFDGDGKPDLAVVNINGYDNSVSIFRNTATTGSINTGSLAAGVTFATGSAPAYMAVGDIDGDRKADVVIANIGDGNISVLRNDPFYASPTITSVSPLIDSPGTSVTITGTNFNTVAASDIVYFGATRATVNAASATSLSVTVPVGATYAPVTVDNMLHGLMAFSPKAFLPDYNNSAYLPGIVNFDPQVVFTDLSSYNASQVVIADIDGDGKPDMVVAGSTSISIYLNTSTSGSITSGSFASPVDFAIPSAGGSNYFSIIGIGDIDGDGKPDLVVAGARGYSFDGSGVQSDSISVFRNTSTGGSVSFGSPVSFAQGPNDFPTAITVMDIDGDGKADVITTNNDGNVVVFRNTAAIGSITIYSLNLPVDLSTAGGALAGLAVGDLDGDGKPDIAADDNNNNVVWVLRNTSILGSIGFATPVSFPTGIEPYGIVIGDIDGDGKPDLAIANSNDNTISLLRNTSVVGTIDGSSFAGQVVFVAGINPWSIASGDFDGDGKPDLAVINLVSSTVSVFRNTATAGNINSSSLAAKVDYATGSEGQGVAAGDIDGDGKADIITANTSAGTVSVLRNDPLMATSITITGNTPLCVSSTITLNGTPAGGTWSSGNAAVATVGGSTGVVTSVSAGTSLISYTTSGGATTTIVTVNAIPTAAPASNGPICSGGNVMIVANATGATNFSWSGPNLSSTTIANPIATPTATATYSLTVSNAGCSLSTTTLVIVNPAPTAAPTNNSPICSGGTVMLAAHPSGGVTNYSWSGPNLSSGSVQNPTATPTVTVATYSLTVSSSLASGCSPSTVYTTTVVVNPLPSAGSISGPSSVSTRHSITLTDAVAGGIWTSSNAGVAAVNSAGIVTGVAAGSAVITYAVTNSCGTAYATTTITVTTGVISCTTASNISTFAGDHVNGYNGDGGMATAAETGSSYGVAADGVGNVYITDYFNNVVRKVDPSGVISTIAGTGAAGYNGDGIAATSAQLNGPMGITLDGAGNIYIADKYNERIRMINTAGVITTIAGNGFHGGWAGHGYGSGGPADSASLDYPVSVAVDCSGNMYIADQGSETVRRINASGIINFFAGTGAGGYNGDGIAAATAQLNNPSGVAADCAGNVYIADAWNNRVRKVDASGIITTIAGNGVAGYGGDGSPGGSAELWIPTGVTLDACGDLYICDWQNNVVRFLSTDGYISTFAGNNISGYDGDGGAANAAELYLPSSLAIDGLGNVYIADYGNYVIRAIGNALPAERKFINGTTQDMTVCENETAIPINSLMAIPDAASGNTETWVVSINPAHGTLSGFNATATSTIGITTPMGLIYTPEAGYAGMDAFTIMVKDGTTAASTTVNVKVDSMPNPGIIIGSSNIIIGKNIALVNASGDKNGVWSSSDNLIATVDASGNVTGVGSGIATISYTVANNCGSKSATTGIEINDVSAHQGNVLLVPNPNNGTFTIRGPIGATVNEVVTLEVTDMLGQTIYKAEVVAKNGSINETISMSNTLANGMYMVNMHSETVSKVFHFVIER